MDSANIIDEEEKKGDDYIGVDNVNQTADASTYFIDGYLKEVTKAMNLFQNIPNEIKYIIVTFSANTSVIGFGEPDYFKIDSIEIANIVKCASFYCHSLFVDIKGNVYGIGLNEVYQLGLNHDENVNMPQLISIDANIVEVAVGCAHSIFLCDQRCIYTMGKNECNQCGQGNEKYIKTPTKCEYFISMTAVKISAGGAHSAVMTSDDSAYLFGWNKHGQCGVGKEIKKVKIPQKVSFSATSLACGLTHTLIISTNNKLYACGRNEYAQIGNDTRDNQFGLIKINLPRDVIDAACGDAHSLCILENGAAYSWGDGDCGQLGHGHDGNRSVPTQIEFKNIKFKKCLAGSNNSCLIDEENNLYCFGENDYGQLCVGDEEDKNIPTKIEKRNVMDISTGLNYSLLLQKDL